MKIPQTTTPLTKFIRTTEGWIVVGANIALIIVPIITSALPAHTAAIIAGALDGVTVFSRSGLKAVAALTPVLGAPDIPSGFDIPESVLAEGPDTNDAPPWTRQPDLSTAPVERAVPGSVATPGPVQPDTQPPVG